MYHDYVSEWYSADGVIILSIIQAFRFSCVISVLSLSIFLTKNSFFKKSLLLSAITWFLLPYGLIAYTWIHDIRHSLRFNLDYTEAYVYNLIMTLPFIIGLGLTLFTIKITTANSRYKPLLSAGLQRLSLKKANSTVEWIKIKGFSNIVAHDYFGIDAKEVWQLIKNKIPDLKSEIIKILD